MQILIHKWVLPGSFEQLADLPRQEITNDWYGYDVTPPAQFAFATDGSSLWFIASRHTTCQPHPEGQPGAFQAELWKYDVAEWFMANPDATNYWEFNLSPNGAWWSQAFKDTRVADTAIPAPEGVETRHMLDGNQWTTMARIPLTSLKGVDLENCTLSACFILNTPDQIFLTTSDDLDGEPDFHRPQTFLAPIQK
jgi:hypothetical protein